MIAECMPGATSWVKVTDKRGVWAYYALVPQALNALSTVLSTTS
jgi:hypothetical protein